MPRVPAPSHRPRWSQFMEDQARQTSTRSGLLFFGLSAAGVVLTEQETTTIMALAGAIAAVFGFIFQDKDTAD
jgi:hypothetical protein